MIYHQYEVVGRSDHDNEFTHPNRQDTQVHDLIDEDCELLLCHQTPDLNRNKKLLVTSASLLVTSALLVVTKSYQKQKGGADLSPRMHLSCRGPTHEVQVKKHTKQLETRDQTLVVNGKRPKALQVGTLSKSTAGPAARQRLGSHLSKLSRYWDTPEREKEIERERER